MKRPIGLWLVIAWCLLRGVLGVWGGVNLARWTLRGYGTWREAFFVFVVEGAIWIGLALGLFTRWNFGRFATIFACAIIIAWASYGFYLAGHSRLNELQYALTVAIYGGIIVYLLRPSLARFFRLGEAAAADALQ